MHDALVEGIVVADDDADGALPRRRHPRFEELEKTLAHGVADATVFPVVCGSATKGVAIDRLADFICEIGPSPAERPPIAVHRRRHHRRGGAGPGRQAAGLRVQDGRRSVRPDQLFKVLSGTIRADDPSSTPAADADERLHQLFGLRGKEHVAVERGRRR